MNPKRPATPKPSAPKETAPETGHFRTQDLVQAPPSLAANRAIPTVGGDIGRYQVTKNDKGTLTLEAQFEAKAYGWPTTLQRTDEQMHEEGWCVILADPAAKGSSASAPAVAKGGSAVKDYEAQTQNPNVIPMPSPALRPPAKHFRVDPRNSSGECAIRAQGEREMTILPMPQEVAEIVAGYLNGQEMTPESKTLARFLVLHHGFMTAARLDAHFRALAPRPRLMMFDQDRHPGWKLHSLKGSWAVDGREPGEPDAVTKKFGKLSVTVMEDVSFNQPGHIEATGLWHGCWSYSVNGGPNHEDSHSGLTPPFKTLDEALDYMELRYQRKMLGSGRVLPEYEPWNKRCQEACEETLRASRPKRTAEIYAHTIEYNFEGGFDPEELPEPEVEHIKSSIDGSQIAPTEDEVKAILRKDGLVFAGDPLPSHRAIPRPACSPLTRVHGRKGQEQEYVEFETPDRSAFLVQRSGERWVLFQRTEDTRGGSPMFRTVGWEPSLKRGEAAALKMAQEHLKSFSDPSKHGRYEFLTTCVGADAGDLRQMYDLAEEVDLQTVRNHCDLSRFEAHYGYGEGGMRLEDEIGLKCTRSFFQGRPCLNLTLGATDHIWIPEMES